MNERFKSGNVVAEREFFGTEEKIGIFIKYTNITDVLIIGTVLFPEGKETVDVDQLRLVASTEFEEQPTLPDYYEVLKTSPEL